MLHLGSVLLLFVSITLVQAQDSVRYLQEFTITAFKSNRPISEVAGSISLLASKNLTRFAGNSLVPAVNTIAGVRMEERSPGSYRFSIRGSLLRSPFGIRNIKFYRDGLPFTDGGGNTYLNLLDFDAITSMEIIKGPGASLYGAGTGGVVLMNSPVDNQEATRISMSGGSYGLLRMNASTKLQLSTRSAVAVRSAYQQADGYREHTKMKRFNAGVDWEYQIGENAKITTSYLVGNLYYQTPGGLTKAQFEEDPKQARPATPVFPGAVEQQAAVTNLTHLVSSVYEAELSSSLLLKVGAITSLTDFENPTIRNYEKRIEKNIGFRAEVQYKHNLFNLGNKLSFGGEFQYFNSPLQVYDNTAGAATNLREDDLLTSSNGLIFLQSETDLPQNFFLTTGISLNMLRYEFTRKSPSPSIDQTRNFSPSLFPRIGLAKKLSNGFSLHGSISQGFSPPSLAEVRPSTGAYNNTLNAEIGLNTEIGIRGQIFKKAKFDLVAYNFKLNDAIVIQRNNDGAEYFVNAGRTSQQGIELSFAYNKINLWKKVISADYFLSYTGQYYFFKNYVQDGNDYSDNKITGVAPNALSTGLDINLKQHFYINTTANYYDHIPLNDANTVYSPYFWLITAKAGYRHLGKLPVEVFFFIDNLLNEKYSLGNDLNAIGARYYNAASGRNFSIGIEVKPSFKRRV
ncbi:TonB-dependent receptor [Chryseotalea sanaruensis]|uniref:TonB-dependent receptor n=1 Tax=Chryseotalea sanaruensis TaxID=2482724 RepID=A0A401UBV2_9BACT|nr:TonB-dependent receptor [Chryseotalea sanaruensis]GCC52369.1 TonB-dependent receptor [Chryseotalea sanaruensis]